MKDYEREVLKAMSNLSKELAIREDDRRFEKW